MFGGYKDARYLNSTDSLYWFGIEGRWPYCIIVGRIEITTEDLGG